MKETHHYTLYHPRWYRSRVSTYWWIRRWKHFKFILRELTSIAVAYFVILMLLLLGALSEGRAGYEAFLELMQTPVAIVINVIAFLFALYHTITWFNLAPSAMPIRVGGKRLPGWMVALPNYIAWLAVSAVVAWFVLGGKLNG